MGSADYQVPGEWNARCSMCGFKRKSSYLVKNWQGLWRCPEHNEPRHPQDFVKAIDDNPAPPWTQPGGQTFTFGDFIVTEASIVSPPGSVDYQYILTEDSYPITTETT